MPEDRARRSALHASGVLIVEQGGRGGVADYTGCLAAALAARGLPVTIATARDHRYPPIPGVTIAPIFAYVRGDSPLARFVRRSGLGRAANGLRMVSALPALMALSRRHAVTHSQGWEAPSIGVIGALALRAAGARLIYTAHNTFERADQKLPSSRIFPALARQTIVHTAADRDRLSRPSVVIPHGTYGSLADQAPAVSATDARADLGIDPDALVVLLFGHLRIDKGLNDLLDAAVQAPPWQVLVAGLDEGALAGAAERLRAPALRHSLFVHEGFHELDAVARFFAAADLVAVPYQKASQSGVLMLAYGFARAVAAYPVGGLVEAVQEGETGWVCKTATPEALAEVLREAGGLGREQLRERGERARAWAAEQFNWSAIAAATEQVYETALRDGG